MYKYLNDNNVRTSAWYCSDYSVKGGLDVEFGKKITWDIPLLDGYESHFFKNISLKKTGFFRFINFGMIAKLASEPKSVIIVHGYHYFTHFMILMLGGLFGHTICFRSDVPYNHEVLKTGWKQKLKRLGLKHILFPKIKHFMYVGTQNKLFYESFDFKGDRLVSCPYAIDNDRFRNFKCDINEERNNLGIDPKDKIIVFSAKYINKKRPLDLLKAFHRLKANNIYLIFVGDGGLRGEMEKYIEQYQLKKVLLTGFVNQSEIPKYYSIADLFVMCSGQGEHWGLSANEAMNFDVPMVLSDLTGCSIDLVKPGKNGYIFKTGDVDQLTSKIKAVLVDEELSNDITSKMIIDKYSYKAVLEDLVKLR